MGAFADYPSHLQHTTVSRLVTMEGTIKSEQGDSQGALDAYKKAAAIGYAVRGGAGNWNRARDLWRVVGGTLKASNDTREAIVTLREIYETTFVRSMPEPQAILAFVRLTLQYELSWWLDGYEGLSKRPILAQLAKQACQKSTILSRKKNKASKKKNTKWEITLF